jgi:hypothetical protein
MRGPVETQKSLNPFRCQPIRVSGCKVLSVIGFRFLFKLCRHSEFKEECGDQLTSVAFKE